MFEYLVVVIVYYPVYAITKRSTSVHYYHSSNNGSFMKYTYTAVLHNLNSLAVQTSLSLLSCLSRSLPHKIVLRWLCAVDGTVQNTVTNFHFKMRCHQNEQQIRTIPQNKEFIKISVFSLSLSLSLSLSVQLSLLFFALHRCSSRHWWQLTWKTLTNDHMIYLTPSHSLEVLFPSCCAISTFTDTS